MYLFTILILFVLIKNESDDNICETGKEVNEFSDCEGKTVKSDSYCCFVHLSYLGPHAKYCYEFPKKDIDNNKVKQTINLIQDGKYWFMRIHSIDIHSIECDHAYLFKKHYLDFFYIYLLILFFKM